MLIFISIKEETIYFIALVHDLLYFIWWKYI